MSEREVLASLAMSRKRTSPSSGPAAAAAAPAIEGAEQVAFAFKAALHSKDREDPCRLSGELCVWMRPATGCNLRRTLVSGSSITGRVTSSREPGHLAQLISGRLSGDREHDERGKFFRDSRQLHLSLCGLEVSVGLRELHTWEQGEGGKLVLSNSGTGDLFFADEIAILFTTLSASRPSEQPGQALPATAAKKPRRSARLTTTAPTVPAAPAAAPAVPAAPVVSAATADPWSDLASRFLARNFRPISDAEKDRLRQQALSCLRDIESCEASDKQQLRQLAEADVAEADKATHIHTKSGQCHAGHDFATAAVGAYQEYLKCKARHSEAVCQIWIDEVWHTHLQDVGAYQRDCATLLGDGTLIEHAPLPPSEQRRRYRATHKRRRDAKQSAAAGEYEHLFWPEPRAEAADSGDEQDDFSVDSILEKEDVVCG